MERSQIWETKAFSLYTNETEFVDEISANTAVESILRFMVNKTSRDLYARILSLYGNTNPGNFYLYHICIHKDEMAEASTHNK